MEALIILASYLIGSIPFAYIGARLHSGKDLRREGSGNIGTRNAFEVTGSRKIGIIVLILDLLKGFGPIFGLHLAGYDAFISVSALMLVIGHCYPVWLRFHGGRGLAPGAGAVLLLQPLALVVWLQVYYLSSLVRKNVHLNSILALICSAFIIAVLPAPYFFNVFYIAPDSADFLLSLRSSLLLIVAVIFLRHIEPLREYLSLKEPTK
jgi:glycerol-3-phosphate acyltransferase PlsY